jgi:hypothetical protein
MQMQTGKETHKYTKPFHAEVSGGKAFYMNTFPKVYCWKEVSCNKLTETDN